MARLDCAHALCRSPPLTTRPGTGNNAATTASIASVETENKWLRRRVADLQEIVEAFQDSMGLAVPESVTESNTGAERSLGALV